MSEFKRLKLKQYPQIQARETAEAKFWKSFSLNKDDKVQGSPNCIDFNPFSPDTFIVTSSTKVALYNAQKDEVMRSFSRFDDDAYSGRFRKDGKLLVAGEKTGYVKVFDVHSKAMLRRLHGHNAAVKSVVWTCDGLHILSGSDDCKANLWDLATGEKIWDSKDAHTDYIRSVSCNPISPHNFVSCGYDHSICLWDSRQSKYISKFNQGNPIEDSIITASGTMLITTGGNEIKIWDLLSTTNSNNDINQDEGKVIHSFSNHSKNITCMCIDGTGSKLLSGGLDGLVKIYSLSTLTLIHGSRYNSPILSLAISKENNKLIVGFTDGTLMIRNRKNKSTSTDDTSTDDFLTSRSNHSFVLPSSHVISLDRTAENSWDKDDVHKFRVQSERSARLKPYEQFLKKFQYQQTLDAVLSTKNPLIIITILEELCHRSGLTIALSGRDEVTLEPLMSFIVRYITAPRYSTLIAQIAHRVLDLYGSVLGISDVIDELFHKLHAHIKAELGLQRQLMRIGGSLDGLTNASTTIGTSDTSKIPSLTVNTTSKTAFTGTVARRDTSGRVV